MKRKIISLILIVITLLAIVPCTVSAAKGGNTASPYWDNTASVSCKIAFLNDGYGYAEAHVMGHLNVSNIKADVYVYRQEGSNWVYVGEKHENLARSSLTISCKFVPVEGAYYRADYTFVVTKNGVDETITKTKYKTNGGSNT